jgi:DtxR family Mn-dependent transcriptional regulator
MEDYVGKIWRLTRRGGPATTSDMARKLGITPASVSGMFRKLADAGLVEYREYAGVILTAAGNRLAMKPVRRHRIIERFLVDVLSVPWDEVDAIADPAEHIFTDSVVDRMEAFMDYPTTCPHGYPIPDRSGQVDKSPVKLLSLLRPQETATIARVAEYDSDTLRYLASHRLMPGEKITMRSRDNIGVTFTLQVANASLVIGLPIAEQIWVYDEENLASVDEV